MSNFHDNNTNYSNYNGYPNNPNNPNDFSGGGNRNGRRSNAVVIVSIALVMLILGGLLGVVIVQGMNSQQAQLGSEVTATPEATATPAPTQQAQAVSGGATTSLAALSDQIADVVASVQDSVVGIHNYQTVTTGGNYGGYFGGFYFPYYGGGDSEPQTVEQLAGSGSGVIYSADGYVITNYHVIEGASRVTVVLHSGEEIEAEVIGGDELQDIALLKVDRTDLSPATLGDSDQVRTGEFAIAIGSPLGDELSGTTTYGIISYANRTLEVDGAYLSMIQTDAAINAGNSGGALLNVDGEVIGINSRKTSGSTSSGSTIEGIGFAIPINDVKDIVEELIATGTITRPGLGITGQEVHFSNMDPGILVVSVNEGLARGSGRHEADGHHHRHRRPAGHVLQQPSVRAVLARRGRHRDHHGPAQRRDAGPAGHPGRGRGERHGNKQRPFGEAEELPFPFCILFHLYANFNMNQSCRPICAVLY